MTNLITPYNPDWKTEFESLQQVLAAVLAGFQINIEHVGSTAIPGLCAKPVLDIDIVLHAREDLAALSERLEAIGYKNAGEQGIAGRFAFKRLSGSVPLTHAHKPWQDHHLYVCYSDSLALKNHLVFRDILLSSVSVMKEYAQLKESLVQEALMTRDAYTKRKTEFIVYVLESAGFSEKELEDITRANV